MYDAYLQHSEQYLGIARVLVYSGEVVVLRGLFV